MNIPKQNRLNEADGRLVHLIGLGGAGVNVLDQIMLDRYPVQHMWCVDTDYQSLVGSVVPQKIWMGRAMLMGLSTRGDEELAGEVFEHDEALLNDSISEGDVAIILTGLAGGIASGMCERMVQLLKKKNITVLVMGFLPFDMEGGRAKQRAVRTAQALEMLADGFWAISNQSYLKTCQEVEDVREHFHSLNQIVASMTATLWNVLSQQGATPLMAEDVLKVLRHAESMGREHENFWMGVGKAHGENRAKHVLEQVLDSALVGESQACSEIDQALVVIESGATLSVNEYQFLVDGLKEGLQRKLEFKVGAWVQPKLGQDLRMTVMLLRGESLAPVQSKPIRVQRQLETPLVSLRRQEPVVQEVPLKQRKVAYFDAQSELPLDARKLKGRFEKSDPTIFNGEDLDEPTYRRLGLKLRV